jgi:zinc/manganese transport system substrate-binding protein
VPKTPLLIPVILLVLAGCSAAPTDNADDGVVRVVASTNVYGDLAATVGGDDVEVTSLIDKADQDPHEFQASGRVQLALSKADIVIENGGGYDDFVDTMLSAANNPDAVVLNAVDLSGYDSGVDGFNEHVFYDYPTMQKLVDAIVGSLSDADPAHAADFAQNAQPLREGLGELIDAEATLAAAHGGTGVVITEPVPLYLLDASGFVNKTPAAFSEAIEQDTDIPPALLQRVLGVLADGSAALVVYNSQTGGPQTDAILDAAREHGVPAIPVTETLPTGNHYISWQKGVLSAIANALGD